MNSERKARKKSTPHNSAIRPHARQNGLVVQSLADELLVYDLEQHKAHCLNQTAMRVWHLCDGQHSVAKIAERLCGDLDAPAAEALVWHALDQLRHSQLLQEPVPAFVGPSSMSRRTFLRKAAVIGGISIMAPVVSSVLAPLPAQAASGDPASASCVPIGSPCAADFQCCSNFMGIKNCKDHICQ
jgi:hypothetical protein